MGDAAGGERFFPPREERTILVEVIEDFPFPLALTYTRLQQEMDRQEPVAAAWQLRDAFEVAIKFAASIAVADALASAKDLELSGKLAGILLTPQGLSLGHWHGLLETALEPLKPFIKDDRPRDSGRLLPELFGVFYETTGRMRRNAVSHSIIDGAGGFVPWRNRVFGHGVFKEERTWYADETNRMLYSLHALYVALGPVLSGWSMVSVGPDGQELPWQGAQDLPVVDRHRHEPADDALPIVLVERAGARRLPLTPFLSIQRCSVCGQPAAFFFDRQKKRDRTILVEYARGHHQNLSGWDEIARLQSLVPPQFEWTRDSYDSTEIAGGDAIAFRDFDQEFTRPGYLLDAIWEAVEADSSGYVRLVGPEGTGKTWLVQGFGDDARGQQASVLPYYIRPGALTDAITFLNELHLVASDALPDRTPAPQLLVSSTDELRQQFAEYLAELIRANNLETLVIAIDALDELGEPPAGAASITDLLPLPGELPEGCWFLLTSRESLRPAVRAGLQRLSETGERVTTIRLDPHATGNQTLVRAYLEENLPEVFRTSAHITTVLKRSDGIFLYASHFAHALASGVFTATVTLPEPHEFYPAYLARIRKRVGERTFEDAYLQPLILLTVAQQPVTIDQLVQWGVPCDRLQMSLFDLRDFLRVQRVPGWHDSLNADGEARYELAHEALGRYVRTDPELAERSIAAHARIANQALTRFAGRWDAADPYDDADLYILGHLARHLQLGGVESADFDDEAFARTCVAAASTAQVSARHSIAVRLYQQGIDVYRALIDGGHSSLVGELAMALMNRGDELRHLGRPGETLAMYDEAIAIWRSLMELRRPGLTKDLATALVSRGVALRHLGRLDEAATAYAEAIAIYRVEGVGERGQRSVGPPVNLGFALRQLGLLDEAVAAYYEAASARRTLVAAGQSDQSSGLARVLVNLGYALRHLGRLDEAIAAYDEAIAIRRQLAADRTESASGLARALVNLGYALRKQKRLDEAEAAYDEAIAIYHALMDQGRPELANNLARVLLNKAIMLKGTNRFDHSLECLQQAISLRERAYEAGMRHLLPELLRPIRHRAMTLSDLQRWQDVAGDVVRFFQHGGAALEVEPSDDRLAGELGKMLELLRELEKDARELVFGALGPWEASVRSKVEGGRS